LLQGRAFDRDLREPARLSSLKALAKEAKMNFMIGRLDKLFGGLVGETEKKTAKFLEAVEAASPVILFLDELDSVLSSGRALREILEYQAVSSTRS
jgi:AAA+ superfamily predicted ATPase